MTDRTRGVWYSNRVGKYELRAHTYSIENNVAGNYSRYRTDLYAFSNVGWGSYQFDQRQWNLAVAGNGWSGSINLDFRPDSAGKVIYLATRDTGPVYHDGNGYLNFTVAANHLNVPTFGSADMGAEWLAGDRLPRVPQAPYNLRVRGGTVQTTSFGVEYTAGDNMGAGIDQYQVQWATDAGFGNVVWNDMNSSGYTNPGGGAGPVLAPGTAHYVRVRAHNSSGWGAWSGTLGQTTLPGGPPGIRVDPDVSGKSVLVTMNPPGNVSGVNSYRIQRRNFGSTTISGDYGSGTIQFVDTNVMPDNTYEWRASANIGTYSSPFSDWVAVRLPSPNRSPGQFFSGASPAKTDVSYSWQGAAQNSPSLASGVAPRGWAPFGQGSDVGATPGVVQRVTGGRSGNYSARVIFHGDLVGAFDSGQDFSPAFRSPVSEGGLYFGSLYLTPSKGNRIYAYILWFDEAGAAISASNGGAEILPAGATALVYANGYAPAGARSAVVRWRTVAGAGYASLLAGDTILQDDAAITLAALLPWFSGDTVDAGGYAYEWLGLPNESASRRVAVEDFAAPDPLADPDCPPLPAPPLPPQIASECIVDVGTWRRYTVQIPTGEVRRWADSIPTIILKTGAAPERQVRIRIYENPDGVTPEAVDTSQWVAELILTYIPASTVLTLDGITERVRAEVAGGSSIPANHLLYGTNGVPATWPVLSCGVGYVISLDVPLEAPSGNLETRVLMTVRA